MGGSKSKPVEPVLKGPSAPEWLQEVHLQEATPKKDNPLLQDPPGFKYDLPESRLEIEFKRKAALECTRRCLHKDQLQKGFSKEEGDGKLTYPEQLCINRCISKLYLSREVIETKLKHDIEQPPILF